MPQKKLEEDVVNEIESEENYIIKEINYKNQNSKIKILHTACNTEFLIDYDHWHNRHQRCPKCGKLSQKKSNDQFIQELENKNLNNKYKILSHYINKKTKIKVQCLDCGNIYEILPCNIYKGNCKYCAALNRSKQYSLGIAGLEEKIQKTRPDYELVDNEYLNNKSKIRFKHTPCGTEFEMSPVNFFAGGRCPKCFAQTSSPENEIKGYLSSLNITTEKYFENFNQRRYELDIYNKERNIGIEYDGLYWHSNKFKSNNAMKEKLIYFNNSGIRVVNIFEDEWNTKNEIVKDKLMSIYGICKERIYARKCHVKEITCQEKNDFLEKNHIQGKDTSSLYIGLVYENSLVAVMTFSKLRKCLGFKRSSDGVYELSRFAGKLGFTIVGGFSKLLDYGKKKI